MSNLNQTNAIPVCPKSICGDVAKIAKDFLLANHSINYEREEPLVLTATDLLPLIAHVKQHFTLLYNAAHGTASAALFKVSLVNSFIKKDHQKFRRTPDQIEADKETTRLKNESAKRRKSRETDEKLSIQAAATARAATFVAPCQRATECLKLSLEWQNLLFTEDGTIIGGEDSPDGAFVLLDYDESKLISLYEAIKVAFAELRGDACEECDEALAVIQKLENSWYAVRSHPSLIHLNFGNFIHRSQRLPSAPVILPPKKKSGGQLRNSRYKSGHEFGTRVGGLSKFSSAHTQKLIRLDESIEKMGGGLQGRALKEDDATLVQDNKLIRKSLRMTPAQAKQESLCPTKHQEMTTDVLKGNYQSNK